MYRAGADDGRQLSGQLDDLVVRRLQLGLGIIAASLLVSIIVDHAIMAARPIWADAMDGGGIVLVLLAFAAMRQPAVRAHPIPFALFIVAVACAMRLAAGIWFGDVLLTAIFCVVVVLTVGATLPWGVWPQLAAVAIAAAVVALNARIVGSTVADPAPHLAIAVGIPLGISVVLAHDLRRHRRRLLEENLQRRRAEERVAQLNADLERRVVERTAELAAATRRLEDEALQRQQATAELRASERRLQEILDNAPAAIHVKDVDGRYQLVNRHWETIFGIRRDEVVGRTLHDVFPSAIADVLRGNDARVLAAGAPLQVEETLQQLDGLHTFVSVKFPLFDDRGDAIAVCGISTDITARKHMEAELRRSAAAVSALVENTIDSIWSVDLDGKIQATNSVYRERFRTRFGVEYDPAISEARVPREVREDMMRLYERAFAGEHVQVERTIPFNGEPQHFLISVHPIVDNAVVTGATVFSKDITARKRVEAQALEHQAELAHVLRLGTMGEMAAGLAHEINQPLGAIANYAQGCVHRLRDASTDVATLLPIMEQIAAEALRAGEIIRRLRELVRKESPVQQEVDLNGLVRKSVQMIEPEARQQGVRLVLALADLPRVTCTSIQIEQVVLNLLLNAIDAVVATEVRTRSISIVTAPGAGAVEVSIRDSGVGIPDPPADVFAPFFSTKPHGLGMGLSISRSIIEAHGGRVSAMRNPEGGSTFRFTLPVTDASRRAARAKGAARNAANQS